MTASRKHKSECGAFICCGAAGVTLNHIPGEPTFMDRIHAASWAFMNPDQDNFKGSSFHATIPTNGESVAHSYTA